MRATDALGRYGEDLAARYLHQQGYAVVARNWRCEHGEIDIVAHDGHTTVVCEVKTRRSLTHGDPREAVTPAKLMRLRRLALCWLDYERSIQPSGATPGVGQGQRLIRIDVVAVWVPHRGPAHVQHLKAVG